MHELIRKWAYAKKRGHRVSWYKVQIEKRIRTYISQLHAQKLCTYMSVITKNV